MSESATIPAAVAILPANLGSLVNLASVENPRYAVTGVRLQVTPLGYRCDATDGRVMGSVKGIHAGALERFGAVALPEEAGPQPGRTVPGKTWAAAFEAVSEYQDGVIAATVGPKAVCLSISDGGNRTEYHVAPVEGRYPDVDAVIPKGEPVMTFNVDPKLFARLLDVANVFVDEEHSSVTIKVWSKDKPIAVYASTPGGPQFTGAIMPRV